MGAFKHLKCMQRSLMHPGLWLLQRPLQILECGPEWSLNKLCAYAIKTKLCCFLSTYSTRQGYTELRHCCVGISLIPKWREIGACAAGRRLWVSVSGCVTTSSDSEQSLHFSAAPALSFCLWCCLFLWIRSLQSISNTPTAQFEPIRSGVNVYFQESTEEKNTLNAVLIL